jgi:hypothetical protein
LAQVNGCNGLWVTYFAIKTPPPAAPCRDGCTCYFLFVSQQPDDPVVNPVINSIAPDQKVQVRG